MFGRQGRQPIQPGQAGDLPHHRAIVIVGSGFSGLGMAIQLKRSGMHDFVILEKASELGGTWRDNTYPGAGCDVPSHLYSYSFEPNPAWSSAYARQDEIWEYLEHCASKYRLWPHLCFDTEVVGAEFDDAAGEWSVTTGHGQTLSAAAVVFGIGALHQPAYPNIPGTERFRGTTFHSAQWDPDCDLDGKRVAVVGTGASAIQFVPEIAPKVEQLSLFQRTPPWVLPKADHPVSARTQRLFSNLPSLQWLYRSMLYWQMESRVAGFIGNSRLMHAAQQLARRHIRRNISDPELRQAVTPDYTMGCKRVLISNDYYPALNRSNVDVIPQEVAEVREHSVVTRDGSEHPVDVLIFGTGFHVTDAFDHLHVTGKDGAKIQDAWRDGMEAYLGVSVAGFPNMFLLLGPNTGLGHNSMIFMIEAQIRYVLQCLRLLEREGASHLDVRPSVQRRFNEWIQHKMSKTVWVTGGCDSWYLDSSGKNTTLWPGSTLTYWLRTRRLNPADYELRA